MIDQERRDISCEDHQAMIQCVAGTMAAEGMELTAAGRRSLDRYASGEVTYQQLLTELEGRYTAAGQGRIDKQDLIKAAGSEDGCIVTEAELVAAFATENTIKQYKANNMFTGGAQKIVTLNRVRRYCAVSEIKKGVNHKDERNLYLLTDPYDEPIPIKRRRKKNPVPKKEPRKNKVSLKKKTSPKEKPLPKKKQCDKKKNPAPRKKRHTDMIRSPIRVRIARLILERLLNESTVEIHNYTKTKIFFIADHNSEVIRKRWERPCDAQQFADYLYERQRNEIDVIVRRLCDRGYITRKRIYMVAYGCRGSDGLWRIVRYEAASKNMVAKYLDLKAKLGYYCRQKGIKENSAAYYDLLRGDMKDKDLRIDEGIELRLIQGGEDKAASLLTVLQDIPWCVDDECDFIDKCAARYIDKRRREIMCDISRNEGFVDNAINETVKAVTDYATVIKTAIRQSN